MEKVERESSSKPIDLGKYPPLYLVDRWDYFIKRFAKEDRIERIEYEVSFVERSWRAESFQSRVHDNCTHGVEVIGEAGRLRGAQVNIHRSRNRSPRSRTWDRKTTVKREFETCIPTGTLPRLPSVQ